MKNFSFELKDIKPIDDYRKQHNTSVLTILFTDIENSTKLREELGERGFNKLLEKHDSILLPLIEKHNGLFIKNIGDSILSIFAQPSDAIECSINMQDAIFNVPLIKPYLKIRIGIDMGQVAKEQIGGVTKDIFGRFVNRAARVESLANGGHILTTEAVQDNASGWIDGTRIKWHDHGSYTVKGIEKPVKIWEPYNANFTVPDKLDQKDKRPEDNQPEDSSCDEQKGIIDTGKIVSHSFPQFQIVQQDILSTSSDLLICPVNSTLIMADGLCGKIMRLVGIKLQIDAMKYLFKLPLGQVKILKGNSQWKYIAIANTVGSLFSSTASSEQKLISNIVYNTLKKSEALAVTTIHSPLLGTGAGRINIERSIDETHNSLIRYSKGRSKTQLSFKIFISNPEIFTHAKIYMDSNPNFLKPGPQLKN